MPSWAPLVGDVRRHLRRVFLTATPSSASLYLLVGGVAHAGPARFATPSSSACRRWGRSATARCSRVDGRQPGGHRRIDHRPHADGAGDGAGVRQVLALDGAPHLHREGHHLAAQRRPHAVVPPGQRARQPDRRRADQVLLVRTERTTEGRPSTGCSTSRSRGSGRCRCRAPGTRSTSSIATAHSSARRLLRWRKGDRAAGAGDRARRRHHADGARRAPLFRP